MLYSINIDLFTPVALELQFNCFPSPSFTSAYLSQVLSSVLSYLQTYHIQRCIYFCQITELNTKILRYLYMVFHIGKFSRLFWKMHGFLLIWRLPRRNFATHNICVCSKSQHVPPVYVVASSNLVALFNGVLCELRKTSRFFGTSSAMGNFVLFYEMTTGSVTLSVYLFCHFVIQQKGILPNIFTSFRFLFKNTERYLFI